MILNKSELIELTGRRIKSAQVRALRFMGIEHKIRPDGSVVVLRAHVEKVLGLKEPTTKSVEIEPNWDAI